MQQPIEPFTIYLREETIPDELRPGHTRKVTVYYRDPAATSRVCINPWPSRIKPTQLSRLRDGVVLNGYRYRGEWI